MFPNRFLSQDRPQVTFRKWGRKGYSVFSSLHKIVRIAVLSTSYLLFAIPASAEKNRMDSPNDTIKPVREVEMEEVVVSAQRAPQSFSQTARIVQVLTKDALEKAPVRDLQDLLKFASGVDVRQRSPNGVQADISIRGSSFDQVLILLNGIPLNDPQTGHHNLNLPVSYDAIERIEILEGPASRLFGPNAFSGAINIITGKQTKNSFAGRLGAGQYGLLETSLSQVLKTGLLTSNFTADFKRSDGALPNTDFKIGNAYYHGNLALPDGNVDFQAGYADRGFGANEFYTPVYPNQYERIKTTFASAKINAGGEFHLSPSFYWRRNQDRFELFRDYEGAPSWYKMHNYHLTDTYGTNLGGWMKAGTGKIAYGTDFRSENIWSTVLGKEMGEPVSVPGESGVQFTRADSRSNLSLYGEYSNRFGRFDISGGLMANWNSSLGKKWEVYPGVDIAMKISNPLKLYVSWNKSLRLPTFTDLYYKSATNVGNPNLLPEKANSMETGIKFNHGWLTAHLAFFERLGQNMIDWVREPDQTLWYAKNLTSLDTRGIELSATINPALLAGREVFLQSVGISYGFLAQDKESGTYISKYLLDYLKHKLDIRVSHVIIKNLSAGWMISYQDRNGTFTVWEGNKYGSEINYEPLLLVDGRINWQVQQLNLFVQASNLLNRKYYDYGNVEQPGIWAKAGLSVRLGK